MTEFARTPQQQQQAFASALVRATPRMYVTWIIVALNVLVFVAMGLAGVGWLQTDTQKVLHWGADYWPYTTAGQWWRLITCAFVHFGALHIAMNMWALISIGNLTERLYGNYFYAFIYLYSAVCSSLAAIWWDQQTREAGASGAIFGIYGATLAYLMIQRSSFPQVAFKPLVASVIAFIGYTIYFGLAHAGISNSAHIGGLISGFVMGAIVCRPLELTNRHRQTLGRITTGFVFGVATIAMTVYSIPKSNLDIRGGKDFSLVRASVMTREQAAIAQYNLLHEALNDNQLSEVDFAERLDREIIPAFDACVAAMSDVAPQETSGTKRVREIYLHYYEARRDAFRAYSESLRTGDPAKAREYEALLKKADDLLNDINKAQPNNRH